jgi:hypothetical protein
MKDKIIKRADMSSDQLECYGLFCDLVGGEHHITGNVYAFGRGIRCSMFSGMLSTFDFDKLTRLVLLAHDRCIRAEIISSGPNRVGVALHKRHTREGTISQRHPTISQAIETHRKYFLEH